MAEPADFAERWRTRMLSTEPVDRAAVETSLRALYAAAELGEPRHFLWYDSPLGAIWAVAALAGRESAIAGLLPGSGGAARRYEEARRDVRDRLGAGDDAAARAAAGRWLHSSFGDMRLATALMQERIMFLMDLIGDSFPDYMSDIDDPAVESLRADELRYFGRHGGGMLVDAAAAAGAADIRLLMGTSEYANEYSQIGSYGEIARDEQLVRARGATPPPLIQAFWDVAAGTGMWWPFRYAVVLAERPTRVERAADGSLVMAFRDGFAAGGRTEPAKARSAPPRRKVESAPILSVELPRDPAARIARLREEAPDLPHFERYLAGEHEQVWKDLVALKAKVRTAEHAADALAVAYETMDRVARNVRTLAGRLDAIGYTFVAPTARAGLIGGLFGRKPAPHAPHVPPGSAVRAEIAELEEMAGGPLPLSLRAFYEVVGEVNFNGEHPTLAPRDSRILPDPLMVDPVEGALAWLENFDEEEGAKEVAIAPDALHKADISGGGPYVVRVPAPVADAPLRDAPYKLDFVEYLRTAFHWGGFPGWEEAGASAPPEIARLREGLIAF
ncbi:MAG TPA: SMI1/KNR4 family protein [Allosphingosinicella sp.]|jgi:hypothetical protein